MDAIRESNSQHEGIAAHRASLCGQENGGTKFDSTAVTRSLLAGRSALITGATGSGKATFASSIMIGMKHGHQWYFVHDCGLNLQSMRLVHLLWRLMHEIKRAFCPARFVPCTESEMIKSLPEFLAEIRGVAVISLMSVHLLENDAKSLSWIPKFLPKTISFLVTAETHSKSADVVTERGWDRWEVPQMSREQRRNLLKHVLPRHLDLTSPTAMNLLSSPLAHCPLYLKLACEILSQRRLTVEEARCLYSGSLHEVLNLLWSPSPAAESPTLLLAVALSNSGLSQGEVLGTVRISHKIDVDLLLKHSHTLLLPTGYSQLFVFSHSILRQTLLRGALQVEIDRHHQLLAHFFQQQPASVRQIVELPFHLASVGTLTENLLAFVSTWNILPAFYAAEILRVPVAIWSAVAPVAAFHRHHLVLQKIMADDSVGATEVCRFALAAVALFEQLSDPESALSILKSTRAYISQFQNSNQNTAVFSPSSPSNKSLETLVVQLGDEVQQLARILNSSETFTVQRPAAISVLTSPVKSKLPTTEADGVFVRIFLELGRTYNRNSNPDEALIALSEGACLLRMMSSSTPVRRPLAVDLLSEMAKCLLSLNELDAAAACYGEAMNGSFTAETVDLLTDLGRAYLTFGRYIEAENVFKKSLGILTEFLEEPHLKISKMGALLGNCYDEIKDWGRASTMFQRSSKGYAALLGPDDVATVTAIHSLARVSLNLGDWQNSATLFCESIRGWRLIGAGSEASVWKAVIGLGKALSGWHTHFGTTVGLVELGGLERGIDEIKMILDEMERRLPDPTVSHLVVDAAETLASLLCQAGRLGEAISILARAAIIATNHVSSRVEHIRVTLNALAQVSESVRQPIVFSPTTSSQESSLPPSPPVNRSHLFPEVESPSKVREDRTQYPSRRSRMYTEAMLNFIHGTASDSELTLALSDKGIGKLHAIRSEAMGREEARRKEDAQRRLVEREFSGESRTLTEIYLERRLAPDSPTEIFNASPKLEKRLTMELRRLENEIRNRDGAVANLKQETLSQLTGLTADMRARVAEVSVLKVELSDKEEKQRELEERMASLEAALARVMSERDFLEKKQDEDREISRQREEAEHRRRLEEEEERKREDERRREEEETRRREDEERRRREEEESSKLKSDKNIRKQSIMPPSRVTIGMIGRQTSFGDFLSETFKGMSNDDIFLKFDSEMSGFLTLEKCRRSLVEMGDLSEAQIEEHLKVLEVGPDGLIDPEEFVSQLALKQGPSKKEHQLAEHHRALVRDLRNALRKVGDTNLKEIFTRFAVDENADGDPIISPTAFRDFCVSTRAGLSSLQSSILFRACDDDDSQEIEFEEFYNLMISV